MSVGDGGEFVSVHLASLYEDDFWDFSSRAAPTDGFVGSSEVGCDFDVLSDAPAEDAVSLCLVLDLSSGCRVGFRVVPGLIFAEYVSGDDFGVVRKQAGC